jgi:hypothetical protein
MRQRSLLTARIRQLALCFVCACALALLGDAALSLEACGQTAAPQVTDQAQADALLAVFQQQQQLIAEAFSALMLQGPTPQQIAAWQHENAAVFADQQQRGAALGTFSSAQPLVYINEVNIPADATPEMRDFLTVRANLYNSYAQLHNQAVSNSGGTTVSESDVQAAYQAQNAADIKAQARRAQDLAAQSASQPLPVPPPLVILSSASPTMQAFLALRDQLMRQRIAPWNQYVGASTADRDAAIQQWQQQNVTQFQQLQRLAQQLATSGGN